MHCWLLLGAKERRLQLHANWGNKAIVGDSRKDIQKILQIEAPSIVPVSSLVLYSAIKAAIQGGQNNWLGRWMCVSSHAWERTWESE